MPREIPEVVRAAAGLAATVLDEARRLPETLPGLPVRLIGLAMQHAMKLQQQYAGLVARGDELFTGIRGEDEPGLATFDDDDEGDGAASGGYRESAFDRAGDSLLSDPVDEARSTIDELAAEAPGTEEVLDELAIDELVAEIPLSDGPDALLGDAAATDAPVTEDADAVESALLESDRAITEADAPAAAGADDSTSVDVVTPSGDIATVDGAVTDEGVAAVEAPAPATAAPAEERPAKKAAAKKAPAKKAPATKAPATEAAADTASGNGAAPEAATDTSAPADEGDGTGAPASTAPATAPVDGYDDFSVAQLRGRLRGYQLATVAEIVAYEEATKARAPYLTMLRNRLEKLEEQAVESSPLAPRG